MNTNTNAVEATRSFTRGIPSRLIAVAIMLSVFATSVFAAFSVSYTVDVVDDGVTTEVTTTRSDSMEILNQIELSVDDQDRIDLSAFQSGKGGKIVISRSKNVSIEYASVVTNYEVYSTTVKEAIEEVGIAYTDKFSVNFNLDEKVTDGMVISIVVPNPVQITVDGGTKVAVAVDGTVADFLSNNGIVLGESDIVTPSLDTPISEGLQIVVNRVMVQQITETQGIPFKTKTVKTNTLPAGTSQVQTEGADGVKEVTFNVTLVDGVETERTFASEVVIAQPVTQVVLAGTKREAITPVVAQVAPVETPNLTPETSVSNPARKWNGIYEGQVIGGKATHYCACATCNGSNAGKTSSGLRIYNGMANPYIVATNWLPLGTKIKVNGVMYTVADRGGSGFNSVGRVDIFTPGGHAECYRLGAPSVTIEIVQLGSTN